MGKARIIILLVAALAGGAAFFLVSTGNNTPAQIVDAIPRPASEETIRVLIASKDFPQGAVMEPRHTTWIDWPKSKVPEFYITESNREFVDALPQMRAIRTIAKNEPIYSANTVQHGDRGMLAAIMTPGMRAVSAKVTAEQASGGFVLPGDRVDVHVSGVDPKDPDKVTRSALLLTNVRVLAIDQAIETEEGENAIVGRSVTLEVAPEQVDMFVAARDGAALTLVLRSVFEGDQPTSIEKLQPDDVIVLRYGQG